MAKVTYDKQLTALIVIDPYNDFTSEGGKIWDRIRAVAKANDCSRSGMWAPPGRRAANAVLIIASDRSLPWSIARTLPTAWLG